MTPEQLAACRADRSHWSQGPWDTEPDRVDFRHAGFACFLLRNHHGAWCGYVGVPSTHPAHGKNYDDVDVQCHGGLTYSAACDGERICHMPQPGEPDDLWWFGFDCWHFRDASPLRIESLASRCDFPGRSYRTLAYARGETESLAMQLKALSDSEAKRVEFEAQRHDPRR